MGKIAEKRETGVVVNVGGVGYFVSLPSYELDFLKEDSDVRLYTHLSVKEDALDLYGSSEKIVIDWFKLLLGVKGIGPKSALSILSLVKPKDLAFAIKSNKSDILIGLGLGKKTAERIVLELASKAMDLAESSGVFGQEEVIVDNEALLALESLGYSREQARQAIRDSAGGSDVQNKIREALKVIGKSR